MHRAVVTRMACVFALCASANDVRAGFAELNDGITGDGHTIVRPDDYGTYGVQAASTVNDVFYPQGVANPFGATYITGVFLAVTTPGNVTSKVALTEYSTWWGLIEDPPPQPDGIVAGHAALTRTVTTPISATMLEATSAFAIGDTGSGLLLDFALVQTLTPMPATFSSDFDQVYTITNNGSVPVDVVFQVVWELDLYYTSNSYQNDIVGVGPGFCSVYVHDPGSSVLGIALGDGGSTVPMTYYYGGKQDFVPDPSGPAMEPLNANRASDQHCWNAGGIPTTWRNFIPGAGYNAVGESGTISGDATIGTEYRFSIAVGTTEKIHLRRRYGSIAIPCPPASQSCGNNVVESGEDCDGDDTPTCNGATCTTSLCGDGYTNMAAGEDCESAGIDSESCNGTLCTAAACGDGYVNAAAAEACDDAGETAACNADCTPAACGDGYVNAAAAEACDDAGETAACNADCTPAACGDGYVNAMAAEDCEAGELCDPATCTYTFTLGGGCAGCGAGGDAGAPVLLLVWLSAGRRRRRARAA